MAHKIEWTEQTWNPSAGCTKISSGCQNCYAETMAIRLQAMGVEGYENGFVVLGSTNFGETCYLLSKLQRQDNVMNLAFGFS